MGATCLVSTSSAATRAAARVALLLCLNFAPGLALQQVAPARESLAHEGSLAWHDNQLRLDEGSATRTIRLDKLQRLDGATGKCLNFLHIPKTAGTSIEEVSVQVVAALGNASARTAGFAEDSDMRRAAEASSFRPWGMHDSQLKCGNPVQLAWGPGCEFPALPEHEGSKQRCSLWHTPPAWDKQLAQAYAGCTTFCVVREPIARIVSEAQFQLGGSCNATQVTSFVSSALDMRAAGAAALDCHLLPQAEFVHGGGVMGERGDHCQRVLKMENLAQDFAALMQEFEVKATLVHADPVPPDHHKIPSKPTNGSSSEAPRNGTCSIKLPADLRKRVVAAYAEDYKTLDIDGSWARKAKAGTGWFHDLLKKLHLERRG